MSTRHSDRDHAIVIGGSMMGLLAARVLAHHFQRVTVIERDRLPTDIGPRKGVPQGRHAHGLLAYGLTNLEALFPGLENQLVAAGAIPGDIAETLRWYQHGAFKLQFRSGFHGVLCSRPLLESVVRQRVLTVPNVTWRDGYQVARLLASSDRSRVTGVVVRHATSSDENGAAEELLTAALIVDATGRGSRAPAWLERLGFSRPPETSVTIDVGYATRIFRRSPGDVVGADAIVVTPTPPHEKRAGVLFPMEGDRWMLTLAGWAGDHPPSDERGYLDYARSLPSRAIFDVIARAEPLGDIVLHKFPSNLRRHYERLRDFPEGYLVVGDAVCSFNPIYGQGMTSAALQAAALDAALRSADRSSRTTALWRDVFARVSRVVDIPWQVTAGADFQYPEVIGVRPPAIDAINWYVTQVQKASAQDGEVYRAFLHVMNFQKAPPSIFAPRVLWRVARAAFVRGQQRRMASYAPVPA